ncbi:MAG TPA: molybdate ABC transporter substrate-binding protein [Acidimicrobiia bacterium]
MRRPTTAITFLVLLISLAGCARDSSDQVLVSAAASLTNAFSEIATAYEEAHAGVDVVLNFAGSSTLREQILEGAPVDVFASANQSNMEVIVDGGLQANDPVIFAENLLQIAVPPGNPAAVSGLEDFAEEGPLFGLCAPEVPCGDFARQALANGGVDPAIDTNEPDVRALLTKIEAGELDAGIVYVTDLVSSGGAVEGVAIPDDLNVIAEYPIVVIEDAPNPDGAVGFVEFVLSDEGRSILIEHGFAAP